MPATPYRPSCPGRAPTRAVTMTARPNPRRTQPPSRLRIGPPSPHRQLRRRPAERVATRVPPRRSCWPSLGRPSCAGPGHDDDHAVPMWRGMPGNRVAGGSASTGRPRRRGTIHIVSHPGRGAGWPHQPPRPPARFPGTASSSLPSAHSSGRGSMFLSGRRIPAQLTVRRAGSRVGWGRSPEIPTQRTSSHQGFRSKIAVQVRVDRGPVMGTIGEHEHE